MDRNNTDDAKQTQLTAADSSYKHITGHQVWQAVKAELESILSASDYTRWIEDLRLIAEVDGTFLIAARDRLSFDRVSGEHLRTVQRVWRKHDPKGRGVTLECWKTARRSVRDLIDIDDPWAALEEATEETAKSEDNPPAVTGRPEMSFETLVTGPSNTIAVKLAKRIAAGQHMGAATTLMFGHPGIGKTHLMQALKLESETVNPDQRVLYMTAEEFLSAYQEGAKARDTRALKARFAQADLVIVDDLHRISGKPGTETELFQSIREVTARGGRVVLCCDEAPGNVKGFSPRMRSELKGAAAVEVGQPDDDMRRAIVERLAAHIHSTDPVFKVTPEMVSRIVGRIRGPGRELCGAVWSLYTETAFGDEAPTLDMLDRVIARQEGEPREPTIGLIKKAAMRSFAVSKTDLESPCKMHSVVYPRQLAMYLCRDMTRKSYPQIGNAFGKRDHTTVLYAYRKITKKLKAGDMDIKRDLERMREAVFDLQAAE